MKTVILTIPALLIASLLTLPLAGCGVKGPIKPPLSRSPSAADGLTVRQIGELLILSWNIPRTNQDGSDLQLQGFEIFRHDFSTDSACPDCGQSDIPHRVIDLEYLQNAVREGNRLSIRENALIPGSGYLYRIVPVNTRGEKGPAATIKTIFHPAPAPPRQPIATSEARGVRLRWEPSPAENREAGFLGYNIYRRLKNQPPPPVPINEEYLIDTNFLDSGVAPQKEASHFYTLRSVWRIGDHLLESADSAPASTAR